MTDSKLVKTVVWFLQPVFSIFHLCIALMLTNFIITGSFVSLIIAFLLYIVLKPMKNKSDKTIFSTDDSLLTLIGMVTMYGFTIVHDVSALLSAMIGIVSYFVLLIVSTFSYVLLSDDAEENEDHP